MLVYEAKLEGNQDQYRRLDEAIRTGQFIRNACLRHWLDGHGKSRNDLNRYCKVLADNPDFPWAKKQGLNGSTSYGRKSLGSYLSVL
jgi:putative transposase